MGQPLDIELALTPAVELDRLFARFQAGDGLQLVTGAETEHYETCRRSALASRTSVTVLPKQRWHLQRHRHGR